MSDLIGWYGDLWSSATHNAAGFFLLVLAHLAALVVLGSALAFAGDLGRSFRDGWRQQDR